MKTYKLQVVLLLLAVSVASAQMASSHAPSLKMPESGPTVALHPVGRPVVRVNNAVLTDVDLTREMYAIFPYARQHNGVPKSMEAEIRAGAMKMIVFEELVYQEAKRRQITVPPTQMDRALAEFRKQFPSPQEYQKFVKQELNGSQQAVRARIERSLLIDKLLKLEIESKATVSLVEEKAYFHKHPERFAIPESFAIQSISILPPQGANPDQVKEAEKRAQDALRKSKGTKSYDEFGALAEQISQDEFRVMMGDHKACDRAKLLPVIVDALVLMKHGQVSELIRFNQNAYTILRLNQHILAGTQSFESVKASLREKLMKDKAETLRSALSTKLRKNAKVATL